MSGAEEKETLRPTARELVRVPIEQARRLISSLEAHDQVVSGLEAVTKALCVGLERLADAIDSKQGAIPGVCRRCGCTDENGCAPDPVDYRSCWWADKTKTLCSRCV